MTRDSIHQEHMRLGLWDRHDPVRRVRWMNILRRIVDRRCPVNKAGASLTSDIDIALATVAEHAEAIETLRERIAKDAAKAQSDKDAHQTHEDRSGSIAGCWTIDGTRMG